MKKLVILFCAVVFVQILSAQNVGVGTTAPAEKLHINSGKIYIQDNRTGQNPHVIFDVPSINFKEAGLQFKRAGDTLAAINYKVNTNIPNYIKIGVSNAGIGNDLVVNSDGKTGLGTSSPAVKLHLVDRLENEVIRLEAQEPQIQFRRRTSLANQFPVAFEDVGFVQTADNNIRIGTNSSNASGKFVVRTGGADRMMVDADGNMSIGTTLTAAGYRVNIGGKAICEELKVQLKADWPDYVFSQQYKLPSLKELELFINTNHHLPNIPSAAEVKNNGIEVGDMQKRMMEKIEELTLYIIALQKQVEALQLNNK